MGGQKASAREIHEADADDVPARKAHHEVLHEEIRTFLDDACDHPENLPAASRHETVEKDHGRIETRRDLCTDQRDWLADRAQWSALRSVAPVEAERPIAAATTRERRDDLSSLPAHAPGTGPRRVPARQPPQFVVNRRQQIRRRQGRGFAVFFHCCFVGLRRGHCRIGARCENHNRRRHVASGDRKSVV